MIPDEATTNASAADHGPVADDGPVADETVATALDGLTGSRAWSGTPIGRNLGVAAALRWAVQELEHPTATEPDSLGTSVFLDSKVVWTGVIGGLGAIALRAASAATGDEERAALIMLLETVADTPLAESDGRWREIIVNLAGPLSSVHLGQRLTTSVGRALILDATSWRADEPQLRLLEYAPHGDAGTVPGGFPASTVPASTVPASTVPVSTVPVSTVPVSTVPGGVVVKVRESIGWGGRDRLIEFLGLLRDRGPAPWRPEAVQALTEATGMSQALAGLLLAGLPKAGYIDARVLPKHTRQTLGLKVAEVDAVLRTIQSIDTDERLRLCDSAMPSTPADLWDRGPDVTALASAWIRRFGRRVTVPEDVVADLAKVLNDSNAGDFARRPADLVLGLTDPDQCPWLTLDRHWSIRDGQLHGEGEPAGFDENALLANTSALLWLAYQLRQDDPLRAGLPLVYRRLRERLSDPDLIVRVQDGYPMKPVREQYGLPRPRRKKAASQPDQTFPLGPAGLLVVKDDWPDQMFVRPALLTADDPVLGAGDGSYDSTTVALGLLLDPGLAGLIAQIETGGTGWAQDPLVSTPELVPLVATRLELEPAAARLYLQLLALPDPTDKNVARWNGWTRKQLQPATDALLAAGLVVADKRRKAGRAVFLPGPWLDATTPIEEWKVPLLSLFEDGEGRLGLTVPAYGVSDLFRQAWARVDSGDGPTK